LNPIRLVFLVSFLLLTKLSYSQTADIFDVKLYAEKLDKCDLIDRYVGGRSFEYSHFDTAFFSISYYDNKGEIFGNWSFVSREDSVDQISFSSLELPITKKWYDALRKQADSLMLIFKTKYGEPAMATVNDKNSYGANKKIISGPIVKAMWLIDGQKLKLEFEIDGEHNEFHYLLRIKRFRDYYGNQKLPPWWNGY